MNKQKVRQYIENVKHFRLQKMHLDYVAGILSIPVLITAIIINWGNLTKKPASQTTATPSPEVIIVTGTQAAPTSTPGCIKSVGPFTITSPKEGEVVNTNPVCITLDYSNANYCSVVWSYRINGGAWSAFNTSSPCLYNLPSGTVTVDFQVNSTASTDQKTFTRTFTYAGSASPTTSITPTITPSMTPTASSSAH